MERLAFLPIAIGIALIVVRFDLTYSSFAVLVGVALPILYLIRSQNASLDSKLGYFWILFGMACLVVAYFICNSYGISFETLDHDRSFPKLVRRLPYFGIAFLTTGTTIIAISVFMRRHL
jgi:hypothetical protein